MRCADRTPWLARLLAAIATAAVPALCLAQNAGERAVSGAATLPESNEAMLLTGQVEQAIQRGDYRLAIRLAEKMITLPAQLVVAPAGRTYYPVWQQAVRLIEQLPPDGLTVYHQLYDSEVAARFADATKNANLDQLRPLFRYYRASTSWPLIAQELISRLLDQGAFGEAIEAARTVVERGNGDNLEASAQLVIGLAGVRAWQAAERALNELAANPRVKERPGWPARVEALRKWLEGRAEASDGLSSAHRAFDPALGSGAVWSQPLTITRPELRAEADDDSYVANAVEYKRRLPLYEPQIFGDLLIVRLRGMLWAFDALTLTLRWSQAEETPEDTARTAAAGLSDEHEQVISRDAKLLLSHALRHALSASFGRIYSIEAPAFLDSEGDRVDLRRFRDFGGLMSPNELVARDVLTGKVVWRVGRDPTHPLYGVSFQDAPIALGDTLCVPVQRGEELVLCQLRPINGELVAETPIIGPPTFFTASGGRCLVTADETSVYVCTGNGVVAALGRENLAWKWACTYPTTQSERRSTGWWSSRTAPRDNGIDRPLLYDDLLIVAPIDSPFLYALDRYSGRQRWRIERGAYEFLAGAVTEGLITGGNVLTCVAWQDGQQVRWRSVPLEITGRPVVRNERVYVPTRDGIAVLDAHNGKVVLESAGARGRAEVIASSGGDSAGRDLAPHDPASANLIATEDALYAVSPNAVVKYADPAALRREAEALHSADADDPRARIALAWAQLLAGNYEQALETVQAIRPDDGALAASRDRVLTTVFVALSKEAAASDEKLNWLTRAMELSSSPEISARLACLIGDVLEQSHRPLEALAHYSDLLLRQPRVLVDGGPGRVAASWLIAIERIRAALPSVPPGDADALVESWIERAMGTSGGDSAGAAAALERLRIAVSGRAAQSKIDRLLTQMNLAPEIAALHLANADDATLSPEQRRRLHLERWDVFTALGELEAARAEGSAFRELAENSPPPQTQPSGGEGALTERERVERIEKSLAKQEQITCPPFDAGFRRQWATRQSELVVDSRRPLSTMRSFVLTRAYMDQSIELCSAERGKCWRQTADTVGTAARAVRHEPLEALLPGFHKPASEVVRPAWPVVTYDHLAAVPTRGGLVCVGLGPERGGGKRLWEFPIPDWGDVPADFEDRAVAGRMGVWLATRSDRIVLLDWLEGQVVWQLEVPGYQVQRLELCGDDLIVLAQDQQLFAVDALTGQNFRHPPPTVGTLHAMQVAGGRPVLFTEEAVIGLDPHSLMPAWSQRVAGFSGAVPVQGRDWVAYRERGVTTWRVLDAATGQPALPDGLDDTGDLQLLSAQRQRLLSVSLAGASDASASAPTLNIVCRDVNDGRRIWSQTVQTRAAVNLTQLVASPEWIPILIVKSDGENNADALATLALQLISKETGEAQPPSSIATHFGNNEGGECGVYLLVTPTRMIVQAGGAIAAFGSSPVEHAP